MFGTSKKITIIGVGNMGGIFFKSLLKKGMENLFLCDSDPAKLDAVGAVNTSTDPNVALRESEVMIIAVKPQSFKGLMDKITVPLDYKLVISIMAGVSLEYLKEKTNANRIIRAMPNLPIEVGQGVVGWMASEGAEESDKKMADTIFTTLGTAIEVSHESMLDAITVLSGCGPAYFYLLAEWLADKARLMGFTDKEAQKIAEKTLIGSAELLKKNSRTSKQWRQAVSSPGGVTEAVLDHLITGGFGEIFDRAIEAGMKRNEMLSHPE